MRSVFTRLSEEEYKQVERYAKERKLSIYEAIKELVRLGLSEYAFKE